MQKGNKELLDWINDEIDKLGDENFFHKDYEETLKPVYGDESILMKSWSKKVWSTDN